MKNRFVRAICVASTMSAFTCSSATAGAVLYSQDFESSNTGYSSDIGEFQFGSSSHFLRTSSAPANVLNNTDGNYVSVLSTAFDNRTPTITSSSFDISGESQLQFAIDIATGSSPIWADASNVVFEYQIDGGGWNNIFTADNDGTNFPEIGDVVITNSFETFTANLNGLSGTNMEVRVFFASLQNAENLSIDNMTVSVVPLPAAGFAGLGMLAMMGLYRRIRRR
jgi:hypothetical protein